MALTGFISALHQKCINADCCGYSQRSRQVDFLSQTIRVLNEES